jgi:hypothetical protein
VIRQGQGPDCGEAENKSRALRRPDKECEVRGEASKPCRLAWTVSFCILLLLAGCAMIDDRQSELAQSFNTWLGQSKDKQLQKMGFPSQCTVLRNGEEVCQYENGVVYTYDTKHRVRAWSYNGELGHFTSEEYPPDSPSKPSGTNSFGLPCHWPLAGCDAQDLK